MLTLREPRDRLTTTSFCHAECLYSCVQPCSYSSRLVYCWPYVLPLTLDYSSDNMYSNMYCILHAALQLARARSTAGRAAEHSDRCAVHVRTAMREPLKNLRILIAPHLGCQS